MRKLKWTLLTALVLVPFRAFAHGQEVLYVLSIQIVSVFLFFWALVVLQASIKRKMILAGVYLVSVMATWVYVNELPYLENMGKINALIAFVPGIAVSMTVLMLGFIKLNK